MDPTAEQKAILDAFVTGQSMVIEAGAGTGKTTTLKMLADATPARGQYVAFNRAIVDEAKLKFPPHVKVSTAHSLAFGSVGCKYKHRLNGTRLRSWDVANLLGIRPIKISKEKTLSAAFLASHVMKGIDNFCFSADDKPSVKHLGYIDGIDLPSDDGKRTYVNNNQVHAFLEQFLAIVWADLLHKDGRYPFKHDHYLKMWQLQDPKLPTDFVMFDECQDAAPVMLAAIQAQDHAQLVFVGDSQQQIYEWRGAVNALGSAGDLPRLFLSQSFRFGPDIAEVANVVLDRLDAELRLSGLDLIDSRIDKLRSASAILCRTNALTMQHALDAQKQGRAVHVLGAGSELISFVKAAGHLQEGKTTLHPDLACFSDWYEVREYATLDPQGADLRMMVNLIDDYGVEALLDSLTNMHPEAKADVVISTAHKAKGREWNTVKLGNDFPSETSSAGELRLMYVAATRAKHVLDISGCPLLEDLLYPESESDNEQEHLAAAR